MNLCITFDYELFFGENYGSYDEVLFDYTYKLIDVLESKGVSATFFADVSSIPISKRYGQFAYVDGFTKQIQYMKKHNQDVQLHLHPHWNYSEFKNGKWVFSNKGYRLHDFIDDGRAEKNIEDGITFLKESLIPIDPNYECIAFRAGGFSIQPHEKIIEILYDNGIRIDSSIAPQLKIESEANYYDYCHKLDSLNWNVSNEDEWWRNCSKGKSLLEIPVATIDKNLFIFALKRLANRNLINVDLGAKRGSYISINGNHENKLKKVYKYLTCYNAVSMDAFSAHYLYNQVKRLYRKYKADDQYVAIIGHPKLVSLPYLDNLCRFIDLINDDARFTFSSIFQAYKRVANK